MPKHAIRTARVEKVLLPIFEDGLHVKRILSLAKATVGVFQGASLAVQTIGAALAQAEGLNPKHAVKQVDRLLSNSGVDVDQLFDLWVPFVIGERKEVVVALDWTDFDHDDQTTLALHLVTSHGRATPLVWKTTVKSKLAGRRNSIEDDLLVRLRKVIPHEIRVTILADRGFGDSDLYALLLELRFHFIIRFRGAINVTDVVGETRTAGEWVPKGGRARMLRYASVTGRNVPVPAVVCVWAKRMAEPWCLVCSDENLSASQVVKLYGRRFTIEEGFRDSKDPRFGMGLSGTHVGRPDRRDRLLLLSALAIVLLTLLGAAGESLGMDRMLKVNTVKRRTHSLLRQGLYWYGALPAMPEERFAPLMRRYDELIHEQRTLSQVFGLI